MDKEELEILEIKKRLADLTEYTNLVLKKYPEYSNEINNILDDSVLNYTRKITFKKIIIYSLFYATPFLILTNIIISILI